jgi:hypothetical protein
MPAEYSVPPAIFHWLVYLPCLQGLPTMTACYVGYKVHRGKLLDFDAQIAAMTSKSAAGVLRAQDAQNLYRKRAQRARSIGLYFARIYLTLLMWLPGAVLSVLDTYSAP